MDKTSLSETDIRSKFITPAILQAGWDDATQIREEVSFTKGPLWLSQLRGQFPRLTQPRSVASVVDALANERVPLPSALWCFALRPRAAHVIHILHDGFAVRAAAFSAYRHAMPPGDDYHRVFTTGRG